MPTPQHSDESVTIMTTPERADFLRTAFEGDPHVIFDQKDSFPLFETLANISAVGGSIAILDEAHFLTVDVMTEGIRRFLDDPSTANSSLRLIVVVSTRKPPDDVLDFLVSYCGLYDIIYNCAGAEITVKLVGLLNKPGTRFDTLELRKEHSELPEEGEDIDAALAAEDTHETPSYGGDVRVELGGEQIEHQTLALSDTEGPLRLNLTLEIDLPETEDE